jgi:ABC-type multidrug transport system fused ATPase/permease subunit
VSRGLFTQTETKAGKMPALSRSLTAGGFFMNEPAKSLPWWDMLPDVWQFLRPRRWHLALGFALMAVNRLAGLILPGSSKYLIDDVFKKHQIHMLVPIIGAVLAATAIQGATSFGLTQILSKEAQRLIAELRIRVQAHIGRLFVSYYDSNKVGTLVARIMSDVEGLRNLLGTGLVQFAGGLMTACFALVILLKINMLMTVVAVGLLAVFGLILRRAFRVVRPIFRERRKINAEVTGRLTESIGGVRVVKGYHAEGRERRVFFEGVQRLLDNVLRTLNITSFMSLSSTVLLGLVSALMMYIGARAILTRAMTIGDFVEYVLFLGMLLAPLVQIVGVGTQLSEAMAGLERTREVLQEQPEDEDKERVVALGPIRGDVRFDHVCFAYETGKPVLHDISFHTAPGAVTALVGPSGAGKSTVIGLICAFYKPTSGAIYLDETDLSKVSLDSYRTQLGVVLQESFLFDGTIRENVAFARPEATEDEVLNACRIACVDEFAESFERGYDTIVGERGVKLSGGQRQRVSIARAILANPRILILDEATSSLDSESESQIQEGVSYLMRGRTTFVIAHRLSTIRKADQILVMEQGRIVERGTHESLYASGGRYFDLYTKQYGLESNLFLAPGEGDSETATSAGAAPVNGAGTSDREMPESNPFRMIRS